jgi:type VI secretion system protein ImpA
MLTPELVDALQAPVSEASPCGDDLEYDPAFTALEAAAQGKPEQQFGDTVIPAVEPEWRAVAQQAQALLGRTKDARAAVLLLRACTRTQGVTGFAMGLRLLTALLDRYWEGIHPKLDADDDHDPTMRLNALAPLTDEGMVLRDLYDAGIGTARGIGTIRVRDIAIAHNALAASGAEPGYTAAQVQGGLESIHAEAPELLQTLMEAPALVAKLQSLIVERTGRADSIDLSPLRERARRRPRRDPHPAGRAADPRPRHPIPPADRAGQSRAAADRPRQEAHRRELLRNHGRSGAECAGHHRDRDRQAGH